MLTFSILDEGHSFLLEENMQKYLPKVRRTFCMAMCAGALLACCWQRYPACTSPHPRLSLNPPHTPQLMANASAGEALLEDDDFIESNLMHAVNGCAAAGGHAPPVLLGVLCVVRQQQQLLLHRRQHADTRPHAPPRPPCSYLYCNVPGLEFAQARPSRVYLMALGGSGDMHTPNSVEGAFSMDGQRRQALRLLPGSMLTTDIS